MMTRDEMDALGFLKIEATDVRRMQPDAKPGSRLTVQIKNGSTLKVVPLVLFVFWLRAYWWVMRWLAKIFANPCDLATGEGNLT
jgi:hypothetical protein